VVRYVPLQVWFRFRRAVEHTPTILVVLEQESNAKTCASLVLRLRTEETHWSQTSEKPEELPLPHAPGCLLDGWKSHAEMVRSRAKWEEQRFIQQGEDSASARGIGADFETETSYSRAVPTLGGGPRQK
jgi:hypothetical protein